jgi:thiosulfate/3-mercaptopyruvate sulfurtransferase
VSGPLVSTDWLAGRLGRPDLVILDASWHMPAEKRDARAEFAARHIPGAAFFDIDAIADHAVGLPHMLPPPKEFAAAVRALGVSEAGQVVVYDSRGVFSAPRAWWSLRAMGHERALVLDGGMPRWLAEGLPVESGPAHPAPGDFTARPIPALVADLEAVRAALTVGSAQVVDARSAARFSGAEPEPRPGLRSGHMPGARNLPWNALTAPEGTLASPEHLAAAFAAAGIDPARPVIGTCGSGLTASVLALALARLGHDDAAVYDGSWSEWGARADTEVVTGPPSQA